MQLKEVAMTRTFLALAAASTLSLSVALAQSTSTPTPSPGTPAPSMSQSDSKMDKLPGSTAMFISAQSPNEWLASKLKGTEVLGADDAKIGSVSDILLERDGKVKALIVGVGGFL